MAGTAPRRGITKYGNAAILFRSLHDPDQTYVFSIKREGVSVSSWSCTTCKNMRNKNKILPTVPVIKVSKGVLESDPENPSNPHYCTPESTQKVEAYQIHREVLADLRKTANKPRKAYKDETTEVVNRFKDDHVMRAKVQMALPAYDSLRSSLYRSSRYQIPTIPSISEIPQELSQTYAGAHTTDPTDPQFGELLMQFRRDDPATIYFASPYDLETLFLSEKWVMDGTFKCRPMDFPFAQFYVILGFREREGIPAFYALMAGKTEPTYLDMFTFLRSALIRKKGSIGAVKSANLDFEDAAINAFRKVFPEVSTFGCVFHYTQAMNRQVQFKGLQSVYNQGPNYTAEQYRQVKKWLRRLVALCLLPPYLVRFVWDHLLSKPEACYTGDPQVDANIAAFRKYYEDQWMTPRSIELFNHFNNPGARTTNISEGNNHKFQHDLGVHPRLAVFLNDFQKMHNAIQFRGTQLDSGATPHGQTLLTAANDARINIAKALFEANVALLSYDDPQHSVKMDALVLAYLDEVQHLIGNHEI